jgi:type II secretory pathway pseudopilin PulG
MIQTIIDADRLLAVAVGFLVALLIGLLLGQVIQHRPRPVQFGAIIATLVGVFAADLSIIFTEIGRIGHVLTWRLPTNNVALFLLLYGLGRFLHTRPRQLEGSAQVHVGPYPPPSQIARKNSLIVICMVMALLAVAVLGGAVMVTRANARAAVAKTRADVAQSRADVAQRRADDVQHRIDLAITANNSQFCQQESLIAGLPTNYPPPTSALGEALTSTMLRIQASGVDLLTRFHCPKGR